jgi:CheY-like chemotaxis protein
VSILIVDDSHDKLVALEAVLADMGLNLVCVQSGREALRCLLTQDFAAILLDVNMPTMDGFETASLIRQRQNSQGTPIIFITSYGDDPFVARGYALGAVDYMLTPVVPAVLRTKVTVFAELYRKNLEVRRQTEKLQQRANQLAALAAEVAEVEQRERRRLAQILHDNLQQLLVAARFRIGAFHTAAPEQQAAIVREVDDLLNQSIEASRSLTAELSPPILHDAGLFPALEWLARRMQKNHGMNVEVRCPAPVDFATDNLRSFVFNAVRELLFNCAKHAGVNSARITLARSHDDFVQVTVADSGSGFDPRILDVSSNDRDHFGLFSIRERATLMHGQVDIVSAPGRGTTIVLKMPDRVEVSDEDFDAAPLRHRFADAVPSGAPHERPHRSNGDAPIRVVIADDHEIIRKGLVAYLENQGGIDVVGEAADGAIAVEMTRALQPDVVIMDVSMPGMNGIEATRIIKKENAGVRVIGLSLHKREDMGSAMMLAGAWAYLSKGGPPDALVAAIRDGGQAPAAESNGNGGRMTAPTGTH